MKILKVWLTASFLLLAGCDRQLAWQDFAVLSFSDSDDGAPTTSPGSAGERYAKRLVNDLAKLGVPTEDVQIKPGNTVGSRLHVRIRQRSFTPGQRSVIRAYLIGILEARAQLSLDMKLTVTPRRGLASFRWPIPVYLLLPLTVEVLSERTGKPWQPGSDRGPALCQVSATVREQVPESFARIEPITGSGFSQSGGFAMQLTTSLEDDQAQPVVLQARLELNNSALARLLDEHGVYPELKAQSGYPLGQSAQTASASRVIQSAGFVVGRLDESLRQAPLASLHERCVQKTAALGRPFSFDVGYSMDRLKYVEFLYPL